MRVCFSARLCLSAVALACTVAIAALAQGPRQQLTPEQKDEVGHRGKAVRALLGALQRDLR